MIFEKYDAINVTVPFKEAAYRKADSSSEECQAIGAANILIKGQEILAANSDVLGVTGALQQYGIGCNPHGNIFLDILLPGADGFTFLNELTSYPDTAKIPIIRNGEVLDKGAVCQKYNQVYSLQTRSIESRGWLFDVLQCTEKLSSTFTLNQMYSFVDQLKDRHPRNNNVEAKIRQQLQFLRDKGLIEFISPGVYRKTN